MKLIPRKIVLSVILSMFLIPVQIFAHGTEDESKKEALLGNYVFMGTGVLFFLFIVLFIVTKYKGKALANVKKQVDRVRRLQITKTAAMLKWAWILSLVVFLISGIAFISGNGTKEISMEDIHGLGYSNDGKRIMIPSHSGIKVYSQDHWDDGLGEKHDYMGFSMVDDGFYSSGHPKQGSNEKNPLGLIKSTDEGKNLEELSLNGEIDFHLVSAGYKNHMIYTANPMIMGNSRSDFKQGGMYYTSNEGKSWTESVMAGISGELTAIAAHPTNEAIVAVGSQNGLYLSDDYGKNSEKLLSDSQVTSLFFNNKGILTVGTYNQGASLLQMDIETKQTTEIKIPTLTEDAVMYVAQNPLNEQELVFATFNKDVYVSKDLGKNWAIIANKGKGISQ